MLKRAGDKHPDANTFLRLAAFYESMKDFASAADAIKKAIPLAGDSDQAKLEMQLGIYLIDAHKLDEARDLYISLEKDDPKDYTLPWQLTDIYRQKGQFDKAHEELDKAKRSPATIWMCVLPRSACSIRKARRTARLPR